MKRLIVLGVLALMGCASEIMKGYVGRDITEAVLDYGPPSAVLDMPDGRRAFQWRMDTMGMIPATTTYTGTTYGNTTYGTFNTSGGGVFSQTCFYTVFGQKNAKGSYTIVDFRPPTAACE